MTSNEKRELLIQKVLTRKEKNKYSQDISKRTLIEKGYGDCSGTMWYWYYKLFKIDIGANTEAQINSNKGKTVNLSITNGIPDESKMRKGDLLYFRGSDDKRTKGVGHVEMYIGDGKLFGHGSGVGGTVKDMREYCKHRQNSTSTTKLKNKGIICVKRIIQDDNVQELDNINDIIWEFSHRGIISDTQLWINTAKENNNVYWLLKKSIQYIREKELSNKTKNIIVKELTSNGDNVWELNHRGIISNPTLWVLNGVKDGNIYWLLRKIVYYIRKNNM